MSIMLIVFNPVFAPTSSDVSRWLKDQRALGGALNPASFTSPETSSGPLRMWFREMAKHYPRAEDVDDPDDLRGIEYSFFCNHIEIVFSGPVAKEGTRRTIETAKRHKLGVIDGDQIHMP